VQLPPSSLAYYSSQHLSRLSRLTSNLSSSSFWLQSGFFCFFGNSDGINVLQQPPMNNQSWFFFWQCQAVDDWIALAFVSSNDGPAPLIDTERNNSRFFESWEPRRQERSSRQTAIKQCPPGKWNQRTWFRNGMSHRRICNDTNQYIHDFKVLVLAEPWHVCEEDPHKSVVNECDGMTTPQSNYSVQLRMVLS